ncbi:FixH family protein [Bacillus sp. ISL-47]|nr:FixH family protein [Bacillus sp. ISL-47]MBT2706500.1 FixH family protein [Pseudomonas sp. ISL-84]
MASFLILGGCSQSSQQKAKESEETPQVIEAILQVPETLEASEEASLAVTVKQGNEAVTDADEVKFEVWKEGKKEESEMIEAKHDKEGKYMADYAFADEGIYFVQAHVTARSQHTMPKVSIQVGDMKAENTGHEHVEEGHKESHSHGHDGEVSIELKTSDHVHAKEQTDLSVMLDKEGKPLTEAKVKLEISLDGSTPEWVNLNESEEGEYTADHQFSETGTYIITIHVEKGDDLHEHTETKLTVE